MLNYLSFVHKGKLCFLKGDYQNAKEYFDKAFLIHSPINYKELEEFEAYVKIDFFTKNVCKKTFKNVELLIKKYGYELVFFTSDSIYFQSKYKDLWELISNKYTKMRGIYLSRVNISLRDEIAKRQELDQKFRKNGRQFLSANSNAQREIDSINTERIKNIFETYGYPGYKLIGSYNIDNRIVDIEGILLHTEDSIRLNYFIPALRRFILKGECYPEIYANLIDQYHLYGGKNQIYGTFLGPNNKVIKVDNVQKVDSMRATIGLLSLSEKQLLDSLTFGQYFKNSP